MQAKSRAGLVAIAVAAALFGPARATRADEGTSRLSEVVAARLSLQRQLGEWLERALAGAAHPYRIAVAARVFTRDEVRQIVRSEAQPATQVKVGATRTVKLPGLPAVERPLSELGANDISLVMPGKQNVEVQQKLEIHVERTALDLYVERAMPEAQRTELKEAALRLSGLDVGRGDTVRLAELADRQVEPPPPPADEVPFHRANAGLLLACATFLLSSVAVTLGLVFGRGRTPHPPSSQPKGSEGANGHAAARRDGRTATDAAGADTKGTNTGAPRAFGFLAEATREEQLEVLCSVGPEVAAVAIDQLGPGPEFVRALFDRLAPERRVELARTLSQRRVLAMASVAEFESAARAALAAARDRLQLGGESQFAELLGQASESARVELLGSLAEVDPSLAERLRGQLLVFEDLLTLAPGAVRQLAATLDARTLSLALVGAGDPLRAHVHGAVSRRLRAILEAEAASLSPRADEVEAARREVEEAMRQLRAQGRLERASQPPAPPVLAEVTS